jgi:Mg-chelatase subunit ChlD
MQSTMADSLLTSEKRGPNVGCSTSKVLPLTATKTEVEAAINAMRADGNTNTVEGVMWGWRTLSPEPPFTEGRPYNAEDNQKIMIVMTDGENNLPYKATHNKSGYAAFGYGAQNRLGTTYSTAAYRASLDQKLLAACSNAKAKNIKIYTIAFRLESDPATRSLLSQCATSTSEAYVASDNAGLISVFQGIGRDVSKLRVAG